ncbi:MAG: methyltransferase domain-containing protein [Desulfovibrio sp.]|nr:methyltransferase domain-containing protein [Desulfovibrio sp.]
MSFAYEHYMSEIEVDACGRRWKLSRAASFDDLWDEMTKGSEDFQEDHIPYWTELWPSSIALCQWLARNREAIAGRTCLDLGCGLGLCAMAAQALGARVIGVDIVEEALAFARRNALANGVDPAPAFLAMDWRRPALAKGSMDFVWGGDIMYERRFVQPVLALFARVLKQGGRAWVAEPGREVYQAFLQGLDSGGWRGRRVHVQKVDALYAQTVPVTVAVWEIARGPRA